MTEVSVVIVTYGQWAVTERCLRSLESALGDKLGHSWEVIVVDNNSPDGAAERLSAWSDRVRVKLLPANRNFAGGCNVGADLAEGEVLLFLNNDTEVPPGALEVLAEQVREPGVAAAGCRLLFPDGTVQHAGVAFLRGEAFQGAAMPQHVFHHLDGDLSETHATFEADSVTAACVAIRSDVFQAVQGFDEAYRNGLEDIDLCLRIRVAGHRIVYRGDVTIIHHEGASRGSGKALFSSPDSVAAMRHNDQRFIGRWRMQLGQDDELAGLVWDASLRDRPPDRTVNSGVGPIVIGQPSGVGPVSEESRALLVALAAMGRTPSALDIPHVRVVARPTGAQAQALRAALHANLDGITSAILVPGGPRDAFFLEVDRTVSAGAGTMVRLGAARTALSLEHTPRILAASHAVARELAAQGIRSGRITVLPPMIERRPLGAGTGGVLALLPTHDSDACSAVLDALSRLSGTAPIRLIPTAFRRGLQAEIADRLPNAESLGPCADEGRFAELAASADLLLAADSSDVFDRRALVAASVGTRALTFRPTGPAVDVFGTGVVTSPAGLAVDLLRAHSDGYERATIQAAVREACDQRLLAELLT